MFLPSDTGILNVFSQVPELNNRRSTIMEIDKRAKTAMTRVTSVHTFLQKFDHKPQYSDIESLKIFAKVKEHVILKNIDDENLKKKFLVTKKLFDVFCPMDEDEYRLEDIAKQAGIKTNPNMFKKRKNFLVINALKLKDKSMHKAEIIEILRDINDLKDDFLQVPKTVKKEKQKKNNIEASIYSLLNARTITSSKTLTSLKDENIHTQININRLSSPKKVNKTQLIKNKINSCGFVTPKKTFISPADNISYLFKKMVSDSKSFSNSKISKTEKKNEKRIYCKIKIFFIFIK